MSDVTKIQWAHHTWNPWRGCTHAKLAPSVQKKARASGYKERAVDPSAVGMRLAKQAVTILGRIPDDDDERREAFDFVCDWVEEHFPA